MPKRATYLASQQRRKSPANHRSGQLRPRGKRLRFEQLEKRNLLAAAILQPWDTEVSFDQFSGGDAKVFAVGYTDSGTEQPEFLGFEFCYARQCGGQPVQLGDITEFLGASFGAEAEMEVKGKLGLQYGVYANAGTADLIYDGTFGYEVVDTGTGPIEIKTSIDHAAGGLFTQSPTVRAFAELVVQFEGTIKGQACLIACTERRTVDFDVDQVIPLAAINRNANGKVEIIGTSLLSDVVGVFDQLGSAKQTIQTSERDIFKAGRDSARATTQPAADAAENARQSATQNKAQGQAAEADTRSRVRNNSANKKFGGGKIIQISIGEDPSDLLGIELGVGIGVGWKGVANLGKELGSIGVTVPDIALTDTTISEDGVLSAKTEQDDSRRDIAKIRMDVGAILGGGFGFGRTDLDLTPLSIGLTTASYDLTTSLRVNQDVTSTPNERVSFAFTDPLTGQPAFVDVTVDGQQLENISSVEFNAGESVFVDTGSRQIAVHPQLIPTYTFTNDIGLDLDVTGTLRALALEISAFGKSFIDTDPLLERSNAIGQFDLGSVFDTSFEVAGDAISFAPILVGGPVADLMLTSQAKPKSNNNSYLTDDEVAVFKLTVTNLGPETAENIVVRTELPSEALGSITVDANSLDQQTMELLNPHLLISRLDTLAPGQSHTFEFEGLPDILRSRKMNVFNFASSDSRDANLFNNNSRLEVNTAKNVPILVDNYQELIIPGNSRDMCPSQNCSLRGAIELANRNPGPDVILLRGGDYSLLHQNGPLRVTDSLSILAFPGTTLKFDRSEFTADLLRDTKQLRFRIPLPPGDTPQLTTRQIVDIINSTNISTSFPFDAFPLSAQVEEGDGSGTFDFTDGVPIVFTDAFPLDSNGLVAATINPAGANNAFSIKLRNASDATKFGELFSGLDVELIPFTPDRTRIFEFGGSGENEYLIRGLTIMEGDASAIGDTVGGAIRFSDPDDQLVLDQVTIANSFARNGGAIAVTGGATATIKESTFVDNAAFDFGGAIHVSNSFVSLENVRFERNQARQEGGAIDNLATGGNASQIDLHNVIVANNRAPIGAGINNLSQDNGSQALITTERSAFFGNDSQNAESFAFEGDALIESLGFNLDSDGTLGLSSLGDRTSVQPISIDSPFIPASVAAAEIGTLSVNLPDWSNSIIFRVDDPRFTIEAGVLKLREGQSIAAAGTSLDEIQVEVTIDDANGQSLVQPLTLFVQSATIPPSAFRLVNTNPSSAAFAWDDQPYEQAYRIIQILPSGDEIIVQELPADTNTVTLTDLPALSQATYVLAAVNRTSISRSQPISVQLPVPVPEVPRDLQLNRTTTTVSAKWNPASYAENYIVFHNGLQVASLPASTTSFVVENLAPQSNHQLQVRASNASGFQQTEIVSAVTLPLPAATPTQFRAAPLATNRLHLSWTPGNDSSEQRLYVSENGSPFQLLATLDADASMFDTEVLNVSSEYEFQLRGVNISGQGRTFSIGVSQLALGNVESLVVEDVPGHVDLSPVFGLHPALARLEVRGQLNNTLLLDADVLENLAPADRLLTVKTELSTELEVGDDFEVAPSEFIDGVFYRVISNGTQTVKVNRPDHFRNLINRFDVDGSGQAAPLDALVIINYLNRNPDGGPLQPDASTQLTRFFIDVNADLRVTPIDALRVINFLNRNGGNGEGEYSENHAYPAEAVMPLIRPYSPSSHNDSQQQYAPANRRVHEQLFADWGSETDLVSRESSSPFQPQRDTASHRRRTPREDLFNRKRDSDELSDLVHDLLDDWLETNKTKWS